MLVMIIRVQSCPYFIVFEIKWGKGEKKAGKLYRMACHQPWPVFITGYFYIFWPVCCILSVDSIILLLIILRCTFSSHCNFRNHLFFMFSFAV